jgi:alpha-galactosidase
MSNLVMRFAAVFFTTLSFMLTLCKPGFAQEASGSEGDPKPLKVFVLAGQSNMQGHAHVRTLDHLAMQSETRGMLDSILERDGTPKIHKDVWVSYLSSEGIKRGNLTTGFGADGQKIGPELTFGIRLHELLGEPILLIKTAWGGRSLHTDFRPPSAGPFVFTEAQKEQVSKQGKDLAQVVAEKEAATGLAYRQMIQHVESELRDIAAIIPNFDRSVGYELSGFVWFQGWNDMVDSGVYPERDQPHGYAQYSKNLACLIRDVRKDLSVPDLPFVVGVMGVGGPTAEYGPEEKRYAKIHQHFRDAMAEPTTLAEFSGSVVPVYTEKYWDSELTRLRSKEASAVRRAKEKAKVDQLDPQQTRSLEVEYRQQDLSARELETLQKGVSNAEFHYLGSSRILGGIGIGFAEAMAELVRRPK